MSLIYIRLNLQSYCYYAIKFEQPCVENVCIAFVTQLDSPLICGTTQQTSLQPID